MNRTYKFILQHKWLIVDVAVLISIVCFLLSYFEPKYLFTKTVTTGGDTASHYYYAKYLSETLLPQGKVMGWVQGNYCGFPLFLFYFPFPFVIMAVLDYIMPLEIAFKLVTVSGIFSLPFCAYFSLKLLRFKFPVPIIVAIFTLPFLFMEANSMWGGNIPSTLAGEFTYGLGFSFTILFVGTLYRGITTNKLVVVNALLVFFIGFSHGYTLLFAILISSFFLITINDFLRKLIYLLKVHLLGFCMLAFWLIPLISNTPNTTRYNFIWNIGSISDVFPEILLPFILLAVIGLVIDLIQKARGKFTLCEKDCDVRIYYIWFGIVISAILYFVAYRINVVDIRFLPFLQIFLMIGGAIGLYKIIERLSYQWIVPLIVVPATFVWVEYHVHYIKSWIPWNYTGFESKELWPSFSAVNEYLSGGPNDPRVVYEHSPLHNSAGTIRAFESLPLFSGRSTLEGLYMQSSITSPFVFYIQSEISKLASAPLPDYSCTQFNLKDGIRHLEMFNVRDIIVRSPEVRKAIKKYPEFLHKKKFGPYEVYELTTNENRYVVPLKYKPVLLATDDWKMASYKWFKDVEQNDVHIVFKGEEDHDDPDLNRFEIIKREELHNLPKIPIETSGFIKEEIRDEEILIETDLVRQPLMIKISYHPNWKVEGADKIYMVSPSFMLIYPNQERVRLYYGKTFPNHLGNFLTLAVIVGFAIGVPLSRRRKNEKGLKGAEWRVIMRPTFRDAINMSVKTRLVILLSCIGLIIGLLSVFIVFVQQKDPNILFTEGMSLFDKKEYAEAADTFIEIIDEFPDASKADSAAYFYAICFYKNDNYNKTIEAFEMLIAEYPGSIWVPEAYYHIGLCNVKLAQSSSPNQLELQKARNAFEHVISKFQTSRWFKYSNDRLEEMNRDESGLD